MLGEETISKILKFIIKTDKRQEAILNKITAKHTHAIKQYLKLIEREEEIINPKEIRAIDRLEQLSVKTRNRETVPFDFKELTKLNTVDLLACSRTALTIWRRHLAHKKNWEKRIEALSKKVVISSLMVTDIDTEGNISKPSLEIDAALKDFSGTVLYRRIWKNKPSKPFQSLRYQPRKIPTYLRCNSNILPYHVAKQKHFYKVEEGKIFVKISTLKSRESLELELVGSDYHLKELVQSKFTGGRIFKNVSKNRWEFHGKITKEIPNYCKTSGKRVVIGVDLGIRIDATVVALVENEPLKQNQIFFFKEGDIRRKKFSLNQRVKVLQNMKNTLTGKNRQQATKELKQLGGKIETLTKEGCHRIAKKVASVAKEFVRKGFETHVAIGKLKGIRYSARKGNRKGKKARGRINSFPFYLLTQFIRYKCQEIGVKTVGEIRENWTSRTCHKCDSKNTTRPTQSLIICENCGLNYNADVNGAINIAVRYWLKTACSNCMSLNTDTYYKLDEIHCSSCKKKIPIKNNIRSNAEIVKMIFLSNKKKSEGMSKSLDLCSAPQGINDSPSCDESIGTTVQVKIEEA